MENLLQASAIPEEQTADPPNLEEGGKRETETLKEPSRADISTAGQHEAVVGKSSSPEASAIKSAGEPSPRIPFGLATAGGSGMDFFDGEELRHLWIYFLTASA